MSSIKKNFSYNVIYQMLILIVPLITAPYVSRVLGAEGNGIYSYTYSIVQYFAIFAMLGLNNYGNRTIAKCRDDKEKLSREFSSIYVLQILTTVSMIILYITYVCIFNNQYVTIALIQLIYLISVCFDINWLFFGLEKFKLTVTRNAIIKILLSVSIFIFVKTKENLIIYVILMSGASLLSQLSLWPFVRKEVKFVKPRWIEVKKHFKPNIILFIPVIAVSVYRVMDKIMLGNMTTIENVGYYEYAERIISIPLSIMTALGTVMLPRISNLVAKGEKNTVKFYIGKSMDFMMFLAIPIYLGLVVIAPEFVPIFLGNEFIKTGEIIQYLAITIVFASWANVIRTQYLIPNEKDKSYIISVSIGALTNFFINLTLIPKYGVIGATIGTIFAEFSVMLYQTIAVRKELEIKKYLIHPLKYTISGIIMYIIISNLKNVIQNQYGLIFSQILIGGLIYLLINYKFITENMQYIPILNKRKKA